MYVRPLIFFLDNGNREFPASSPQVENQTYIIKPKVTTQPMACLTDTA